MPDDAKALRNLVDETILAALETIPNQTMTEICEKIEMRDILPPGARAIDHVGPSMVRLALAHRITNPKNSHRWILHDTPILAADPDGTVRQATSEETSLIGIAKEPLQEPIEANPTPGHPEPPPERPEPAPEGAAPPLDEPPIDFYEDEDPRF